MRRSRVDRWPFSWQELLVCIGRGRQRPGGLSAAATPESQSSSCRVRPHYTRRLGKETVVKLIRLVFALMCISIPFAVLAQQHEKLAPETYGTSSLTYVSLSPWDLRPYDSNVTYAFQLMSNTGIYRTNGTGSGMIEAALRLPEGAIVLYLEMYSCNSSFGTMTSAFRGLNADGSWRSNPGPNSLVPGCGLTSAAMPPV